MVINFFWEINFFFLLKQRFFAIILFLYILGNFLFQIILVFNSLYFFSYSINLFYFSILTLDIYLFFRRNKNLRMKCIIRFLILLLNIILYRKNFIKIKNLQFQIFEIKHSFLCIF